MVSHYHLVIISFLVFITIYCYHELDDISKSGIRCVLLFLSLDCILLFLNMHLNERYAFA